MGAGATTTGKGVFDGLGVDVAVRVAVGSGGNGDGVGVVLGGIGVSVAVSVGVLVGDSVVVGLGIISGTPDRVRPVPSAVFAWVVTRDTAGRVADAVG